MRVVVALGGNAVEPRGSLGTPEEQQRVVTNAACHLGELISEGHELVICHGNGPQVGALLLAQRAAAGTVAPQPLDVLVASTQGHLGYLIANAVDAELDARGCDRPVVPVVTRVVVEADDPALGAPDKPVGPHYTTTELEHLVGAAAPTGDGPWHVARARDGVATGSDGERVYVAVSDGVWRRVVASPLPIDVVEAVTLRRLVGSGATVVCGGGGGIPVTRTSGGLAGVPAVVDKDHTAALLTRVLHADALLILTDVPQVALGYGTPDERPVTQLTVAQARAHLASGEFPAGSMGPKVAAACTVADAGGVAVITSMEHSVAGLAGRAGTRIT